LNFKPWTAACWIRWDSNLYLDIARKGYEFVSCKKIGFASINDACGNTAWFPSYPLLIWISHAMLAWASVTYEICAVLIPWIFFFLMLHRIWNDFLDAEITVQNILILLIAAFFPGCVYYHAAFPVSMEAFFLICVISAIRKSHLANAWASGFLAGVTYHVGLIGGGFSIIYYFLKKRFLPMTVIGLSGIMGFLTVLVIQFWSTRIWGTFFEVQKKYGFKARGPFEGLFEDLTTFGTDGPHLQATAVAIFILALFGFVVWKQIQKKTQTLDWAILVGSAGFWLIPHMLGGKLSSFYRGEALIIPSVFLLKSAPKWFLAIFLLAFISIAFIMGGLFFQSLIV
jgi:hypothetical protein